MPSSSAYIPSFSISNFAQSVSAPYTSFGAYASGVIDANGNLLKPESSIDPYEYFVIKLKKIFEELPTNYTKARLNSYMSAFQIFNEEAEFFGIPENHFLMFVEGYLQGGLLLKEDMGAGMATGGSPGSIGTAQVVPNTGTVMGYDKPMDLPLFRRSPVEMFDVDNNEFQNFKNAKAWKHIPDSPTKKYLKRFQQRNPNGKMAIRTKKPDTDEHDLYWITYPAKNFMEEYGLEGLDILNESVVKDYTDSVNDNEINVATKTTAQEIEPIEISGKELETTAEIVRQRYEDEKQKEDERRKQPYLKAGSAEKYAAGTELEKSIPTALDIIKRFGNKGAEIAQRWHGQFRKSAEKEISTRGTDYYGLGNLEGLEDLENPEDIIKAFDAKNIKARGQVNIDPAEFFKDMEVGGVKGFPTVSGTPAHIARALAAKAGDTREADRISSEILNPFYSDPGVQDQLSTYYRSQMFPQNNKVSLRLATKKGRELIPIGVADAETILRRGISLRTTRGGSQPVEKSQLGIQSSSDYGVIAVGKNDPLQTLSREDQSSLERLSPGLRRFSSWLRTP